MKQKIVLIAAVVAGLVAAFLTRAYLNAKDAEIDRLKARFTKTHGTMEVLCWAKDVTGGSVVQKGDVGLMEVPATGLRGQALTEADFPYVLGRKIMAERSHRRGDVVFWADFEGGNPAAGGLAAHVGKGWRAISISVSGASAVSGMVRPNDRVDVIGTFSFPVGRDKDGREQTELVTHTILQHVLVLATGRQTANAAVESGAVREGYSTVTLQVLPREAEILAFAEQMRGRLFLSLRDRAEPPPKDDEQLEKIDYREIPSALEKLNRQRRDYLSTSSRPRGIFAQ